MVWFRSFSFSIGWFSGEPAGNIFRGLGSMMIGRKGKQKPDDRTLMISDPTFWIFWGLSLKNLRPKIVVVFFWTPGKWFNESKGGPTLDGRNESIRKLLELLESESFFFPTRHTSCSFQGHVQLQHLRCSWLKLGLKKPFPYRLLRWSVQVPQGRGTPTDGSATHGAGSLLQGCDRKTLFPRHLHLGRVYDNVWLIKLYHGILYIRIYTV